jgi:hypothetical protein
MTISKSFLVKALGLPRRLAQKMAYGLRRAGVLLIRRPGL